MCIFWSVRQGLGVVLALAAVLIVPSMAKATDTVSDWPDWNAAAPMIFPEKGWQRYATAEEAGWSSEKLAAAMKLGRETGGDALFVVYNGAVLAEWGQTARRYAIHSVRKSLLSALYGIAVEEGKIDLSRSIGSIGIDDLTPLTETEKTATVSNLLESRSGIYLPAAYETKAMKRLRPERGSHAPGTFWYYNNWDFNAVGTIYNRQTGSDLFHDFEARIAAPVGMQDFSLRDTFYRANPDLSRHPAYLFRLTARDMARFGLLFLNEGRWEGQQIIPAAWVADSTSAHFERERGGGYGYMWWTFSRRLAKLGTYAALGFGGQTIIVVPGANLVLVHRVDTEAGRRVKTGKIVAVLTEILKARSGPPKAHPDLVPAMQPATPVAAFEPTPELRARLAGTYGSGKWVVRVTDTPDGLEIADRARGRFRLLGEMEETFLVEDLQREVRFVADDAGKITGLEVETRSGKTKLLPRSD